MNDKKAFIRVYIAFFVDRPRTLRICVLLMLAVARSRQSKVTCAKSRELAISHHGLLSAPYARAPLSILCANTHRYRIDDSHGDITLTVVVSRSFQE